MNPDELKAVLATHALWVRGEGGKRADLSRANLSRADLSGAHLSGADLRWANLRWANLSRAYLSGADLSGAYLSGANLRWANLSGANLSGADLSGARGIRYALASWDGHGECGRMLSAVEIAGEVRFFCGCFAGTAEELQSYIDAGKPELRASRQRVFDFVRGCMELERGIA